MNSETRYGLPLAAVHKILAIFDNYPEIDKVWIYGSRAMGTYRSASDIDLCIESLSLTLRQLLSIENQLDDLLLPWKVDLSLKKSIDNSELLAHINQYGQQFYPCPSIMNTKKTKNSG